MNEIVQLPRDQVLRLESEMRKLPALEIPVEHFFGHKSYARQITIPEGAVVVGKIHKYPQINVLLSGELSVLMEDGPKRIQAPFVVVSPAGTKRAAYAHKESIWLTIHGTEKVDLDELEDELIAKSFEEFDQLCLEAKS